ncbi:hemerythrin domain-containing protein [Streptomyces sp. NPDC050263]|uniref:hemerythrin domain-containing protein n=1 Tax=Streptomyces sp. NPDC050263 TaxID=3155037 RepID=UPI00343FBF3D
MGQGHGRNVIDELVSDHREIEELFGRIEALPPGAADRKRYADRATTELVRHSVAEEECLHPSVRERVPGGDALADTELDDHARAEQIMKDLEGRAADDPEFDRLVGMLMREIRTHLADEERDLFPRLRAACPAVILDGLGDKVRKARKTAPTRPHPSAPDEPPADRTLAPGAGLVDRMRDAMTGRGKPY